MKMSLICILFLCLRLSIATAEPISESHPSAYLRAHANDAVQWQLLNRSVLEQAKKHNKLIFLSSGFSACHWCHVMRKESFNDVQAAAVINKRFIPVKIDRELNPVLDSYLLEFVRKATGYAGWPLNVIITPDGYPLTGFVYLKKQELISVLTQLHQKWLGEHVTLQAMAEQAFKFAVDESSQSIKVSRQKIIDVFLDNVKQEMDELDGGFGMTVKSPEPFVLIALLKIYQQQAQPWIGEFLSLTLSRIAERGLHDMLAGGFFRYTTEPSWQTPHFEKMLYMNAAMIELYIEAYDVLDDARWFRMAEETMDFIVRDMRSKSGEFFSSLSAQDEQGIEGGAYLFSTERVEALLNAQEKKRFTQFAQWVPVEGTDKLLPVGVVKSEAHKKIQQRLLIERNKRPVIKVTNIVKSWNAYVLRVGQLLQARSKNNYLTPLTILSERLKQYAMQAKMNPLSLTLAETVTIADALWRWGQFRGDEESLAEARQLLNFASKQYRLSQGWLEVGDSVLPLPGLKNNLMDGNLPAADVLFNQLMQEIEAAQGIGLEGLLVDPGVLEQPMKYASFVASLVGAASMQQAAPISH